MRKLSFRIMRKLSFFTFIILSYIIFILTIVLGVNKGFAQPSQNISLNQSSVIVNKATIRNKEKPKNVKDVKWLTFEEAQKQSAKNPKKIFVDVYTDWCGWCKKMDKTTLSDPVIKDYLNKKYYSVKLNAESDKKLIYKGKEITERELATKIFTATGYPTTVYLDEQLNMLQPISSYLEVELLDKILHYYGEDFYKNTSWETFQAVYSKQAN